MRTTKQITDMMDILEQKIKDDPEFADLWFAYRGLLGQRVGQQTSRGTYAGSVDVNREVANWISDYPIDRKSALYMFEGK